MSGFSRNATADILDLAGGLNAPGLAGGQGFLATLGRFRADTADQGLKPGPGVQELITVGTFHPSDSAGNTGPAAVSPGGAEFRPLRVARP